jgi:hypothetical protein
MKTPIRSLNEDLFIGYNEIMVTKQELSRFEIKNDNHKGNEVGYFKNCFLKGNPMVKIIGILPFERDEIVEVIRHVEKFECPDGFCTIGNTTYAIDFFQIDISGSSKKGSINTKKKSQSLEETNSIWEEVKKSGKFQNNAMGFRYHSPFLQEGSVIKYVESALEGFNQHLKKTLLYKENLVKSGFMKPDNAFKTIFVLEDVSVDATLIASHRKITLFETSVFQNFFRRQDKVSYAFLIMEHNNDPSIPHFSILGNRLTPFSWSLTDCTLTYSPYVATEGGFEEQLQKSE